MKAFCIILGILLILMSALLAIVEPFAGGVGILIGVLFLVYMKKNNYTIKKRGQRQGIKSTQEVNPKPPYEPNNSAALAREIGAKLFNDELLALKRSDVIVSTPSCKWRNPDTMPGVHLTNITRQTNMEKFFPVVVIDTETTGIGAGKHRIVELSAIKLGPGFVPESCFTTLVNPGRQIPPSAEAVHHISTEMVADAPTFPEIAESFANYIAGCRIVGHNVKFDLEFLYAAGLDLPQKTIVHDTMDLAKKVLTSPDRRVYDRETGEMVEPDDYDVDNYKLTTLCDYYGIYRDDAHRSLSDCLATAKVFEHLIEEKLA